MHKQIVYLTGLSFLSLRKNAALLEKYGIHTKTLRIKISTICLAMREGDVILISTEVTHSVTLHSSMNAV